MQALLSCSQQAQYHILHSQEVSQDYRDTQQHQEPQHLKPYHTSCHVFLYRA